MRWSTTAFFDELAKIAAQAELLTQLKPHQQRVVERMRTAPGLVVAHGLGSGKTLSSIAAALESEGGARVLVPAALIGNYQKELAKHVKGDSSIDVGSLQRAVSTGKIDPTPMLIVDEAHRAKNVGTRTQAMLRSAPAAKRMLLTGSPIYNRPSDIASLVNIAAGDRVLPEGEAFSSRYVKEPGTGFWSSMPWSQKDPTLQNKEELQKALQQWVDYHESTGSDFPSSASERIAVPMSKQQRKLHDAAWGQLPFASRWRLRAGLPPGKEDLAALNKFESQARQVASTESPFTTGVAAPTPKIQRASSEFLQASEKNPEHRALVFSNYLGTLKDYASTLEQKKVPYGIISGKQSQRERIQTVKDYNEGKLRALLLSSAGGEGLDLKGTRQVQILEPHWNDEKIKQVVGRAIRTGSHSHLPESARNVKIQRFESYPEGFLGTKKRGVEQVLYDLSESKERLNQQIRDLMKRKEGR